MLAIDELYREHWQPIYRFLRVRMGRAPDADVEDLAATVFERVVRFSGRYEDRGKARSWLYRIAERVLADRAPAVGCRPREVELADEATGGRATADAGSARHALAIDVARALAGLPDRERVALVERYWMGGSSEATAALLGVSEEVARKLVWRGRRHLRAHLEAMGHSA